MGTYKQTPAFVEENGLKASAGEALDREPCQKGKRLKKKRQKMKLHQHEAGNTVSILCPP